MHRPRIIPTLVFQIIAALLVVIWLALVIPWIATGSGVYRWFVDVVGIRSRAWAAFATFISTFLGWLIIVLPLRHISQMPTMREELGAGLADGLPAVMTGIARIYSEQRAVNEELYAAREYTEAMLKRARQMGVGFLIVGLMLTLAGAWLWMLTLETGILTKLHVFLIVLGPAMVLVGIVQIVVGKSVIRK